MAASIVGSAPARALAADGPTEGRWNELAPLIVGDNVVIPLTGGLAVEGEAISVRDEPLLLDIRRTSDARKFPKGQTAIPRTSVAELRIVERRGVGGRVLGSVVGAVLGLVAGAEVAIHTTDSEAAAVSTFSLVAVGCTVGGYYAGRSIDRRSRTLRIAPPAVSGAPAAP